MEAEETDNQPERYARAALAQYDIGEDTTLTLVNVSENHTFRADDPSTGRSYAVRVHRPGYHSAAAIESELLWIDALRDDDVIGSVVPITARNGNRVVRAEIPASDPRNVVVFEWVAGAPPDPNGDHVPGFRTLGATTARMHAHAKAWQRPAGFERFTWDFDTTLGDNGHWGPWREGIGVGGATRELFQRTIDTIRVRLEAYGKGPERFGLAHCDLRLANLLVDGDEVRVIDFDDCGFGWYMYDYATTISFIEDHPLVPDLRAAWLEGYRSVAPISAEDEAELDTFVMLRRLLLVCWVGSHYAYATEAQELGEGFTVGTIPLAETYLSLYG